MKLLVAIVVLVFCGSAAAQNGTIRGTATDAIDNSPLISAFVYNQGKTRYSRVDLEGNFMLKMPAGTHWIYCEYVGYTTDSMLVEVKVDEVTFIDFKLTPPSLTTFTLQEDLESGGKDDDDKMELEAGSIVNSLGRELAQQTGASDAASLASKGSGASIEGGKYVYVRGLSDRYSKTIINGAEVPGLDPNRNSVQMDLFPTALVKNLLIYKAFTPDLPASFTGGLVDINTLEFPEGYIVTASAKLSFNTLSSFNSDFLGQNTSGSLDFLGISDDSRGIPTNISRLSTDSLNGLYLSDDDRLNALGKEFSRDFAPIRKTSLLNQQYSFTIGNQVDSKNEDKNYYPKLGYIFGATYRKTYSYFDDGFQGRYSLVGDVQTNETLNPELELNDTKGDENVLWATLGNFSLKLNEFNKIGFTVARFQNGITSTRYLEGNNFNDANDLFFQTRTLLYQERSLTTGQLKGEHLIGKKYEGKEAQEKNADNLKLSWVGSFTNSEQITPELKFFTNDYTVNANNDTLYDIQPQLYSDPSQFNRYMNETNLDIKAHLEKPITTLNESGFIRIGGSFVNKFRVFTEKRYDFLIQEGPNVVYTGDIIDFFADENFDSPNFADGFIYIQDASEKRNNYTGSETNIAGYAMGDFYVHQKLNVVAGARVEMDSISSKSQNTGVAGAEGGFTTVDLLPAVSLNYEIVKDTMLLRLAYSRTLARPTFRELAPFASFDFVGGNVFVGNADLKRTLIDNMDLRWEYYIPRGQKLTVGAFAKRFQNPIERAFNPEAANAELTWRNVESAQVYGAEIDFRLRLSPDYKEGWKFRTTIGGNFTYVYSEVSVPTKEYEVILVQDPNASPTRVMFGQAPYIVNLFLQYKDSTGNFIANLNFGVSGRKLSVVTVGGTPNVFENARPALGFNVSQRFGKYNQFSLKFSGKNLIDPDFKQIYSYRGEEYLFSSFTRGRTFSVSFSYVMDKNDRSKIDRRLAKQLESGGI